MTEIPKDSLHLFPLGGVQKKAPYSGDLGNVEPKSDILAVIKTIIYRKEPYKFDPQKKELFLKLPPKALLEILSEVFAEILLQIKSLTYETLRGKSSKELLELIESDSYKIDNDSVRLIERAVNIISFPDFQKTCECYIENFKPAEENLNYYNIYKIFEDSNKDKYLEILKKPNFKEFCGKMKNNYNINPFNDIRLTMDLYRNAEFSSYFNTENANLLFKKVISVLKKHFPDIEFENFYFAVKLKRLYEFYLALDPRQNDEMFIKEIENKIALYKNFISLYPYKIETLADLFEFLSRTENEINLFLRDGSHEIWRYIKDNYPERAYFTSFDEFFVVFHAILSNLDNMQITNGQKLGEFNNLLGLFNLNLENSNALKVNPTEPLVSFKDLDINLGKLSSEEKEKFKEFATSFILTIKYGSISLKIKKTILFYNNFYKDRDKLNINLLKDNYGFEAEDIGKLITYAFDEDMNINFLNSEIKNPETEKNYKTLSSYPELSSKRADALILSIKAKNLNGKLKIFELIESLLSGHSCEDILSVMDLISRDKQILAALKNQNFIDFYLQTKEHFSGQITPKDIPNLINLYNKTPDKKSLENFMFSDEFGDITADLRARFEIQPSIPDYFLLNIAKNIKKIEYLIDRLNIKNERLLFQDLILLSEVAENKDLEDLLFNRGAMIDELNAMFKNFPALPRYFLDQNISYEPTSVRIEINYSERPPLEQVPNSKLLELIRLKRVLEDPKFLSKAAKITLADLEDKSTEYGGIIKTTPDGALTIESLPPEIIISDGFLKIDDYSLGSSYLTKFHCHGKARYAGPSGSEGALRGDLSAWGNDSSGLVITYIGHPRDEKGNIIKNKIRLNFDFYFTQNGKAVKIDLGTHEAKID